MRAMCPFLKSSYIGLWYLVVHFHIPIVRFQVIDPEDMSQRARWTIIATACLLLLMCLLLVGVTLRMAPLIDDMGKSIHNIHFLFNAIRSFSPLLPFAVVATAKFQVERNRGDINNKYFYTLFRSLIRQDPSTA